MKYYLVILNIILFSQISSALENNFCINSAQYFRMTVIAKIDKTGYMVSLVGNAAAYMGASEIGALKVKSKRYYSKFNQVFMQIKKVDRQMIKGEDGFEHPVDFWVECTDAEVKKQEEQKAAEASKKVEPKKEEPKKEVVSEKAN